MATETKPLVVATPNKRFAIKSAAPIKIKSGISFFENPPVVLNLIASAIVTKKVAPRIETIVIKALSCEPIEIKVRAKPKPAAAPKANNNGLSGRPLESSGPLAQKTPTSAITTPIEVMAVNVSPVINAYATGITALIELIGETTPMRPVDKPSYKQAKPMYPHKPARAPYKR